MPPGGAVVLREDSFLTTKSTKEKSISLCFNRYPMKIGSKC